MTAALAPILCYTTKREEKRLAAGHTYEPNPILERRNWPDGASEPKLAPAGLVTLTAEGASGQD